MRGEHRDALIDLESMYTESRYGIAQPLRSAVESGLRVARDLFESLEEVENRVLG